MKPDDEDRYLQLSTEVSAVLAKYFPGTNILNVLIFCREDAPGELDVIGNGGTDGAQALIEWALSRVLRGKPDYSIEVRKQ